MRRQDTPILLWNRPRRRIASRISRVVSPSRVEPVLRLYTEALLGQRMALRTTADLPRGLQTAGRDLPTSDGAAIFVPEHVSDFATERDNFAAYKVAILHQVGFYECGTWQFDVTVCAQRARLASVSQYARRPTWPGRGFYALFCRFSAA